MFFLDSNSIGPNIILGVVEFYMTPLSHSMFCHELWYLLKGQYIIYCMCEILPSGNNNFKKCFEKLANRNGKKGASTAKLIHMGQSRDNLRGLRVFPAFS